MASILETAASVGVFNTLLAAVDAAGLRGALEGPGPFTVFAPMDRFLRPEARLSDIQSQDYR